MTKTTAFFLTLAMAAGAAWLIRDLAIFAGVTLLIWANNIDNKYVH